MLSEDKILEIDVNSEDFMVAQYHPPFTLPFLRRNEIWFSLPSAAVKRIQQQQKMKSDNESKSQST